MNLFIFSKGQIRDIKKFIKQSSFSGNFDNFISFIKNSIWAREYAKFVFSKSIDLIFKNLILFGKKLQLTRDELSYLDINDILNIYYNLTTNNLKINLRNKIPTIFLIFFYDKFSFDKILKVIKLIKLFNYQT